MDEHFMIEPADAGQLRMSLRINFGDTSIGIATFAAAEAAHTSVMGLQADLVAQAIARLKAHERVLRRGHARSS